MITIKRTNSDDTDFKNLVVLLDQDLAIRDGEDHAFYNQFNKTDKIKHVIVFYENDTAVGCGAFREKESDDETKSNVCSFIRIIEKKDLHLLF